MLAGKVVEMTENTSNPLLVGLVEYLSMLYHMVNCALVGLFVTVLMLLGNSSHVSDIKVQERQPANLQLLTSWEVVGVAINDIIL